MTNNSVKLKDMYSGNEEIVLIDQVATKLKNMLRLDNS